MFNVFVIPFTSRLNPLRTVAVVISMLTVAIFALAFFMYSHVNNTDNYTYGTSAPAEATVVEDQVIRDVDYHGDYVTVELTSGERYGVSVPSASIYTEGESLTVWVAPRTGSKDLVRNADKGIILHANDSMLVSIEEFTTTADTGINWNFVLWSPVLLLALTFVTALLMGVNYNTRKVARRQAHGRASAREANRYFSFFLVRVAGLFLFGTFVFSAFMIEIINHGRAEGFPAGSVLWLFAICALMGAFPVATLSVTMALGVDVDGAVWASHGRDLVRSSSPLGKSAEGKVYPPRTIRRGAW